MATLERPQEESTGPSGSGGAGSDVLLRVCPHLLSLPLRGLLEKAKGPFPLMGSPPPPANGGAVHVDIVKTVAAALKASGKPFEPAIKEYCTQLEIARDRCLTFLGEDTPDVEQTNDAVASYISILQGLAPKSQVSVVSMNPLAAETMPNPDGAPVATASQQLEAAGLPISSSVVSGTSAAARFLSSVLEFQWWDLFAAEGRKEPAKGGAEFEMASTLLSAALWKARRAAQICNHPKQSDGVNASQSSEVYRLLREAAGIVQMLGKDKNLKEAAFQAGASDLGPGLLRGLEILWLAEAQSLTVLRALAKESSHKLIAAVARDTFEQYEMVPGKLEKGTKWSSNITVYCAFKVAAFQAHAHIAYAQSRMDVDDAAHALRSAKEASDLVGRARASAETFDKTEVRRDPAEHNSFRMHLRSTVNHAADRITKLNSMVHYKAPAQDLPDLPEASHLADVIPFELPAAAATVQLLNDDPQSLGGGPQASQEATPEGVAASSGAAHQPAGTQPLAPPEKKPDSCCCIM